MILNKYIDHTKLNADAKKSDIEKLCDEAIKYDFKSVCVNPCHVKFAKEKLQNSDVLVCTVIGFPLGANSTETKVFETENAIENGADEIDMVINIGKLKEKDFSYVEEEIRKIKEACGEKTLKVIVETCLLTDDEKISACEIIIKAGADFVKTSTGFSTGGATVEDVKLLKSTVKDKIKIKASGGIRTHEKAVSMIEAGADRIGASAGERLLG